MGLDEDQEKAWNRRALILDLHSKWHTERCQDSSKALSKDQGVGGSPIVGMILQLITQPTKLTTPHFMATAYTLSNGTHSVNCASLWLQTNVPLTYVSHWIFLQWDIKDLSFIRSWNQAPWVLAGLKSQLDTTDWLSIVQSPCHMGLSPNLR